MRKLILFHQPDCHLCDEAETLLRASGLDASYLKVDISGDTELLMRYEIHVPVLQRADDQAELFWPFDKGTLHAFANGNK